MDYEEFIDEIAHHGVKGMKWGVRKDRYSQTGSRKKSANAKQKESRKRASANRRSLSDKDLDQMINRLEKEKKLKNLVADDVSPGRKFINGIMSDAGKRGLTTVATGAVVYGVKVGLEKNFNPLEAAKYLAPKPKK